MLTLDDFGPVTNKVLRQLAAYWLDKRCDRLMPSIKDIDPIEIPWALARIWLCDYSPSSGRFRYRLAGEQINAYWGYNIRGRYLDELVPAERLDLVTKMFRRVPEGPSIVHDIAQIYLTEEIFKTGERIVLPLSKDGRTVDAVLGATCRDWLRETALEPLSKSSQTVTVTPIEDGPNARSVQRLTLNCSP